MPAIDPVRSTYLRTPSPTDGRHDTRPRLAAAPAPSVRSDDEYDARRAPDPARPRGFVLYVDLSESAARDAGTSLEKVANALRVQLAALLPAAETSATLITGDRRPSPSEVAPGTRRIGPRPVPPPANGLVVDLDRDQVRIDDRPVPLAPREFSLLRALVRGAGVTLSRPALVRAVWSAGEPASPADERAVDVTIARLRSRLGQYGAVIRTVRGAGYRFDAHPDVAVLGLAPAPSAPPPGIDDLRVARQILIDVEKHVNDAC